ncbi:MAG TPA: hypothetical protein VL984_07305 [Acidimicrobiales bacterium]|nr:hypothetical protein [Acidimicrobiales bacterium]
MPRIWELPPAFGGKRDAQPVSAKLVTELQSAQVAPGHPTTIGELIGRRLAGT